MRNLKLTIEYDGSRFHGWQTQPRLRTVQSELTRALETILRHPVVLHAAGRTDAGVHALGQVANFETPAGRTAEEILRGVNALTGADVTVTETAEVASDFHARFSARARHYVYLGLTRRSALWRDHAVHLPGEPDCARMNAAVRRLVGAHDFAAFSCRGDDEEGTDSEVLYARWERWSLGPALRIGAIRFLYRMVRCIVGRSIMVGRGQAEPESFAELLRAPAGRCRTVAPAAGLYLLAVDYETPREPEPSLDCPLLRPVL